MQHKLLKILVIIISSGIICNFLLASTPVQGLRITIENGEVVLRWDPAPSGSLIWGYRVERQTGQGTSCYLVETNEYREPISTGAVLYQVFIESSTSGPYTDEEIIEDFESGSVNLISYPGQDLEPNSWGVQDDSTYQNSDYALVVYGNTWKIELITPRLVNYGTVWGIAVETYNSTMGGSEPGEIMGFGLGDGVHELFYTFRGSELADSVHWRTTFHCVGFERQWIFFQLPVGRDWSNAYGYEPTVNRLIYLNDEDALLSNGGIYFDYICDITEDMPIAPSLQVDYEIDYSTQTPGLSIQFLAEGEDPDSDTLFYYWEFGDGSTSQQQNPLHSYLWEGNFSVQCTVSDETELNDRGAIELVLPIGTAYSPVVVDFTGDVMMARRYSEPGGIIPTLGANAIWEPTLDILNGAADLSFINLECCFTTDLSYPHPTKQYTFYGNPSYVNALVYAGIEGVNLANNHTTDYMEPGLIQTMNTLDTTGIERTGSGLDEYAAMQPMVHYYNGVSIGTLGYCNRTGRTDNLPPFLEAGPGKAGFTWFTQYYLEETIPQAVELYDIVVAQVHCGIEYAIEPDTTTGGDLLSGEVYIPYPLEVDSTTLNLQYMALDLGADIVIAHHPHVLQGYEVYNGKLIAHSLGNFVFDQDYFETFPSMILYVELNRDGIYKAWFRPVYIDDYIPNEAVGELGKAIIHRIADYSRDLNAVVMPNYEENIAYIALSPDQIISYEEGFENTVIFPNSAINSPVLSYPLEFPDEGFISQIEILEGSAPNLQVQLGRENLWIGNFEAEGSTVWNLSGEWQTIDGLVKIEGEGSLRLQTLSSQTFPNQVMLENPIALDNYEPYSIAGYIKGINTTDARVRIDYYNTRFGAVVVGTETGCGPLNGTQDWNYFCTDLNMSPEAHYGNIYCQNNPPLDDQSFAWFDEIKLIQWDDQWQILPLSIPYPNNYKFIRFRADESADIKISGTVVKYQKL